MKCPNCETVSRIRKKDKFCYNCGCNFAYEKAVQIFKETAKKARPVENDKTGNGRKRKNIIIASNGNMTLVFIDGKVYGDKITKFDFHCDGTEVSMNAEVQDLPIEGDLSVEGFKKLLEEMLKEENSTLCVELNGKRLYEETAKIADKYMKTTGNRPF